MGSMSIPGHYRSESLLDLDTILVGNRVRLFSFLLLLSYSNKILSYA